MLHVMRVKNLPSFWGHSELTSFVAEVATVLSIDPDPPADHAENEPEAGDASAGALATSPFVDRVRIFMGRRSGVATRRGEVQIRSDVLAKALAEMTFDVDDYRNGMSFERVDNAVLERRQKAQQTYEEADLTLLEHLDLDRYLMSPDVVLDAAKLRQRRYLTRGQKIDLVAFRDTPEAGPFVAENAESGTGSSQNTSMRSPYPSKSHGY